jgi:hypothetical protein
MSQSQASPIRQPQRFSIPPRRPLKQRVYPRPKGLPSERPLKRRAVTIIAGFKTHEGVIICGDTQETIQNLSKKHVTKVKYEALDSLDQGWNLAVAFCGAGEGPFIDLITRKAWAAAMEASDLEDATSKIENSIKSTYREYGRIYQPGQCPNVELLYGVKMNGDSQLFSAWGPAVNEVNNFRSGGLGCYLADFLFARMDSGYLNLYQCAILAAYILFQAKEHVDGCGGDSHIAVLRNNGQSGLIDAQRVKSWTALLDKTDKQLGGLLLTSADLSSDEALKNSFKYMGNALEAARTEARDEIHASDEWWNFWELNSPLANSLERATQKRPDVHRDEFGFVSHPDLAMPSDSAPDD